MTAKRQATNVARATGNRLVHPFSPVVGVVGIIGGIFALILLFDFLDPKGPFPRLFASATTAVTHLTDPARVAVPKKQ